MNPSQLKQLKQMEAELSQYKRMYAELAHENYALKNLIEKNSKARREAHVRELPDYGRTTEHQTGVFSDPSQP